MHFYFQCPDCERVSDFPGGYNPHEPAPCCGATGESRILWPSWPIRDYLKLIDAQDLNDRDGRRIAAVFLCSALELWLEIYIRVLLSKERGSELVRELILQRFQGREGLRQLYNKLRALPLGELLQMHGLGRFLHNWGELADLRNGFVHGRFHEGQASKDETAVIQRVRQGCVEAFMRVHNDVLGQLAPDERRRPFPLGHL